MKLYKHTTDGGAEYLCTAPIEGTDEGNCWTAIVRLDGTPELLNPTYAAAPTLLDELRTEEAWLDHLAGLGCPDETIFDRLESIRAAISRAENG